MTATIEYIERKFKEFNEHRHKITLIPTMGRDAQVPQYGRTETG